MNVEDPLLALRQHQAMLLDLAKNSTVEVNRQYHTDLSPIGWHLGHCVFTETYWIREVVMEENIISEEQRQLYIPEISAKSERGAALPTRAELWDWAADMQRENTDCLDGLLNRGSESKLMEDNYLILFLAQHYAQHIETANYVLIQQQLQNTHGFQVDSPLQAIPVRNAYKEVIKGEYSIGAENTLRHYDNECSAFDVLLDAFAIATTPVSNAEYLGFMEDGGYQREEFWHGGAWRWCSDNGIQQPQHWRQDERGNYYGSDTSGPCSLVGSEAVSGLSLHEAEAFASWAGSGLPHEYQWETAKKEGLLSGCGQVWEWCDNSLHPYPGFEAFPYDGYSLPWFDDRHFTLRGHSQYTLPVVRRDSFRNFYQAEKRHFPAGVRLVRN